MHEVQRAIIMAAGTGNRLKPITLKTPKPLVRVNGVRMIDTIIQALKENGILDIYVVVGYLKEQFRVLEDEYDNVFLIENPFFDACNNISSLYVARDYLEDALILDGDQIVYDKRVLQASFERSGYNAVWTEKHTNEWLMTVEDGIVKSCSRTGGEKGWQLYGVSRWTSEDGKKLKKFLEIEFEQKQNFQIYWDDIAMFCYPEEFQLGIQEMQIGDIIEIDNINELVQLDYSYKKILEGKVDE